jgi:hypothetical protein
MASAGYVLWKEWRQSGNLEQLQALSFRSHSLCPITHGCAPARPILTRFCGGPKRYDTTFQIARGSRRVLPESRADQILREAQYTMGTNDD